MSTKRGKRHGTWTAAVAGLLLPWSVACAADSAPAGELVPGSATVGRDTTYEAPAGEHELIRITTRARLTGDVKVTTLLGDARLQIRQQPAKASEPVVSRDGSLSADDIAGVVRSVMASGLLTVDQRAIDQFIAAREREGTAVDVEDGSLTILEFWVETQDHRLLSKKLVLNNPQILAAGYPDFAPIQGFADLVALIRRLESGVVR